MPRRGTAAERRVGLVQAVRRGSPEALPPIPESAERLRDRLAWDLGDLRPLERLVVSRPGEDSLRRRPNGAPEERPGRWTTSRRPDNLLAADPFGRRIRHAPAARGCGAAQRGSSDFVVVRACRQLVCGPKSCGRDAMQDAVEGLKLAGGPGFEPRMPGSEPGVLPLNYPPPSAGRRNNTPAPPPQRLIRRERKLPPRHAIRRVKFPPRRSSDGAQLPLQRRRA